MRKKKQENQFKKSKKETQNGSTNRKPKLEQQEKYRYMYISNYIKI